MKNEIMFGVFMAGLIAIMLATTGLSQTTQDTVSNVTINNYFAIAMSDNLTEGILFGSANPNTNNNNASHNYDGAGDTSMWLVVSSDSNVNVDFCIKDDANLTYTSYNIPNTGYTYSGNVSSSGTNLVSGSSIGITTSFIKFGSIDIAPSSNEFLRAWLDVPSGQNTGTYANNINFKGIQTGGSC